jgi:hypothetical protein
VPLSRITWIREGVTDNEPSAALVTDIQEYLDCAAKKGSFKNNDAKLQKVEVYL